MIGTGWMSGAELGATLREIRESKDLSMTRVCAATGLAQTTLHRYETGKVRIPYDVLADIAGALGLRPAELLCDAPRPGADAARVRHLEMEIEGYKRRVATLEARLKGVTAGNCYDVDCLLRGNHEGLHYDGIRRYYTPPQEGTSNDG